jgi:hypothetical protein
MISMDVTDNGSGKGNVLPDGRNLGLITKHGSKNSIVHKKLEAVILQNL